MESCRKQLELESRISFDDMKSANSRLGILLRGAMMHIRDVWVPELDNDDLEENEVRNVEHRSDFSRNETVDEEDQAPDVNLWDEGENNADGQPNLIENKTIKVVFALVLLW